ncbi:MAG: sensor domain-containing protein [Pontibacterium sp.]
MEKWLRRVSRSVIELPASTSLYHCWEKLNEQHITLVLFYLNNAPYLIDRMGLSKHLMEDVTQAICLSDLNLRPALYAPNGGAKEDIQSAFHRYGCEYLLIEGTPGAAPTVISVDDFYSFVFLQDKHHALPTSQSLLASLSLEFAGVFRHSPIAMSLSVPDTGFIVEVNQMFVAELGFSAEEMVGHSALDLGLYRSPLARQRMVQQLNEQAPPQLVEVELCNKSGRWSRFKVSACTVEIRGEIYLLTMYLNETELQASEQMLVEERNLFASGPVAVIVTVPYDGWPCCYATNNLEGVLGVSGDRACEKDFRYFDMIHPDDQSAVKKEFRHLLSKQTGRYSFKYRVLLPDGSVRWIQDNAYVSEDVHGQYPYLVRRYLIDVTWQMDAERTERLAASVFEHAHESILITDADFHIVDVNPRFTDITGYSRDEVMHQSADLLVQSEQQKSHLYRHIWRCLRYKGKWQGEINQQRKDGSLFNVISTISAIHDERGELQNYIITFTDITLMKAHQEELEHLAHYDALTGLPNRVLLAERMTQALKEAVKQDAQVAVCYLDLDGFKAVNDKHGHKTGDALLVELGRRLRLVMHSHDTVARLGGDEFVFLLVGLKGIRSVEYVVGQILDAIAKPMLLDGTEICVTASIGIALVTKGENDPDTLVRHADQAMYQAKLAGRNGFQVYDPEEDKARESKSNFVKQVSAGIKAQEFVLYFQPKVDLLSGEVVGCEALVRWNHPQQGLLQPHDFLPDIADTDVEIELDRWVLVTALGQQAQWLATEQVNMPISVNISGKTFVSNGFVDFIRNLLLSYPYLAPGMLELEVLETAALADMEHATQVFSQCQAMGLQIALDDFGTGYSSLTYCRRLPAETLKIDRSFVRDMLEDMEDKAIVESVIGLGHAFNKQLVAEGVEVPEQGYMLVEMGCTVVQGYGIARPMPDEAFLDWAKSWVPTGRWADIRASHSAHLN